ncbi:hypothetical protein HanRHA438_Chr05g0240331 [Helianthus annuus]|nr:hypothetical protein HanRHA438_Chr05g0240331 [Helianthus annuus]
MAVSSFIYLLSFTLVFTFFVSSGPVETSPAPAPHFLHFIHLQHLPPPHTHT